MDKRSVLAVRIGEFTKNKNCVVRHKDKVIMNLPMEFLHNGLPQRVLHSEKVENINAEPKLPSGIKRDKEFLALVGSANVASNRWISEQYDHEVQASSVVKPLTGRGLINTDAQVIKPVFSSDKAALLSYSVYPSYSDISTYHMTSCAIDTAVRNIIASGGSLDMIAILDNTCWCSSYDPKRLAELVDAIRACSDTAIAYGTPFISGKDSMFNDFKGYDKSGMPIAISIPPTLLISAIGMMKDFKKSVSPEFKMVGDVVYLIGETHDELGASEYYKLLSKNSDDIGNVVPKVDTKKNTKTYRALEKAIAKELIASAISLNSGGLAVALTKASVGGMLGGIFDLKNMKGIASNIDAKLFSESQGRILVTVAKKYSKTFEKMMKGVACKKIGSVTTGKKFIIKNGKDVIVNTTVDALSKSYNYFSNSFK